MVQLSHRMAADRSSEQGLYRLGTRRKITHFSSTNWGQHFVFLIGSASARTSDKTPTSRCLRAVLRFALHMGLARAIRATRGKGRVEPLIRKDPGAASYGCPTNIEKDNAIEGGEERRNTRSTFETFKYNSCNIRLKVIETLETYF
jgi:hypothetical protein